MGAEIGVTEETAARAYAKAWNRLDCAEFLKLLAPDASYSSFWVFNDLEGREAIVEYLTAKMRNLAAGADHAFAELATTTKGFGGPGRPCVALAQGDKDIVKVIVTFEVEAGLIKRVDLAAPEFFAAIRSGEYPR